MGAKVTCFGGGLCLPICFSPKISTFDSTGDEIVTGATKPQSRRPASLKNKLVRYFSCLTKRTVPIEVQKRC